MNTDIERFFKGGNRHVYQDPHEEIREMANGVYGWWWKFLQLSPVIWFAKTRGVAPKDPEIARTVSLIGDIYDSSFAKWWEQTGRELFAEAKRPPKVKALTPELLMKKGFQKDALYIEVPMNLTLKTIMRNLGKIVRDEHLGRQLNVLDHSNAQFKLAKKLKKFDVLERMYWVHLYRELYPEITAWQIGDRLRVSPALDVVNFNRDAWKVFITNESSPLEKMQSLVGRDIYNARYLLLHMERGSFPKHTKFELSERHQPFGLKFQTEYRQATESTKDKKSEWHQWLEDRYGSELFRLLKEKHHFKSLTGFDALEREKKLEHMKKYDRFKRYVRGEINHWA